MDVDLRLLIIIKTILITLWDDIKGKNFWYIALVDTINDCMLCNHEKFITEALTVTNNTK